MEVKVVQRQGETQNLELIKQASEFILREIVKPSYLEDLSVTISMHSSLPSLVHGDVTCHSEKKFRVRLDRHDNFIDMISTLAHELVHVKQYATGELSLTPSGKSWRWKGQLSRTDPDDEFYNDEPWEREAFRKESSLAKKFINTLL